MYLFSNATILKDGTEIDFFSETYKTIKQLFFDIDIKIKSPRDKEYRSMIKQTLNMCDMLDQAATSQVIQFVIRQYISKTENLGQCPFLPVIMCFYNLIIILVIIQLYTYMYFCREYL